MQKWAIFNVELFCSIMINSVGVNNILGNRPQNIPKNSPGNSHLSVLCSNDAHGNLDNISALLTASKKMDSISRSPGMDTLKISAGDNWAGGNLHKNTLTDALFNHMKFDYSAVGNHEFDGGIKDFADKIDESGIKFLAANLDIEPGNPLYGKIHKSDIKVVNGTKYGIIGATTPELGTVITTKDEFTGLNVQGEKQTYSTIQQEVIKLMEQGVDRIILTSHCGLEFDQKIAQNVAGIDVIVSGHSHDLTKGIEPGKNYFHSPSKEPVLIIQSGENVKNVNVADVMFDDKGIIARATNTTKTTQQSSNALIAYLRDSIMGVSPTIANITQIEQLKGNRRIEPHGWANFTCDAMRAEFDADIAFMNAANMRKVPLPGMLTERDIQETSPMKNKLIKTSMTEAEIVTALKNASLCYPRTDGYPGLLQVSGLRYKIDTQGNLLEAGFADKNGNSTPINIQNPSTAKTYSVVYDSFMEDGREYPDFMLNGKQAQWFEFDKDTCIINYLAKMPEDIKNSLKIVNDGRIEIQETSKPLQPNSNTQNFLGLTLQGIA